MSYRSTPLGVITRIASGLPPQGGRVTWLICAQRPFCFSCFIISVIALAWMWSLLCSAVSINWWRCCQRRVGAFIDSRLISRSVMMIWAHIVPYVDVRGLGRLSLRQSLIIFRGLGTPTPIIHRQTLWRSHRRLSQRPTVGLYSMCPIMNLLQCDSECIINCVSSLSHESINWIKSSFARKLV